MSSVKYVFILLSLISLTLAQDAADKNRKSAIFNQQKFDSVFSDPTKDIRKAKLEVPIKESDSNVELLNDVKNAGIGHKTIVGVQHKKTSVRNISNNTIPTSCKDIYESGNNVSGVYQIQPRSSKKPFFVLCDMEIRDGGWTHIQKRFDGSQDFYLDWRNYKFGFGDLDGDFWLGLENIYGITGFEIIELLVELEDRDGNVIYAHYENFAIGSELEGYPLNNLKNYSGDAGDALTYHLGSKFSTKDFDRDESPDNCAEWTAGAWWYKNCFTSNLNGKYLNTDLPDAYKYKGMHWNGVQPDTYTFSKSRMLVRLAY